MTWTKKRLDKDVIGHTTPNIKRTFKLEKKKRKKVRMKRDGGADTVRMLGSGEREREG